MRSSLAGRLRRRRGHNARVPPAPPLPRIGVVVAAHANARALDWTLLGYRVQRTPPHELIVAEDGERDDVRAVVDHHRPRAAFALRHLHQPHDGFGKWRIVNRAIVESDSDFLVFTDADCVPREDLVAAYAARLRRGGFLAGGSHVNLPAAFHEHALDAALIETQRLFDPGYLRAQGVAVPRARLLRAGWLARLLDRLTPRDAFVGNNAGAWRDDLLRVAGFDEAMGYGGADRNLGIRLNNAGVRGARARHSLVMLHLDHPRSYRHAEQVERNKAHNRRLAGSGTVLPQRSSIAPAAR